MTSGRGLLLSLLVAAGLGSARAAEPDPLEALRRRFDERRAAVAHEPAAREATLLAKRRDALACVLEEEAGALDRYAAGTADSSSRAVAMARATDARVEALGLLVAATDSGQLARADALARELTALGGAAEERAATILLAHARALGQAADFLDARIRELAPALLETHGHVVLLELDPGGLVSSDAHARRDDDAARVTLARELAGRGLEVRDGHDARRFGARGGIELVVDATGHVRGVDLVGDERRALVLELLKQAERP